MDFVDLQNEDKYTALILASRNGCIDTIRFLLENGADPNLSYKFGNIALMQASRRGYTDIVNLLSEYV